jgi:hypothetical protein
MWLCGKKMIYDRSMPSGLPCSTYTQKYQPSSTCQGHTEPENEEAEVSTVPTIPRQWWKEKKLIIWLLPTPPTTINPRRVIYDSLLFHFVLFFWDTVSPMRPKLASNRWSSCLSLLSARVTDVHHHTWHFLVLFSFFEQCKWENYYESLRKKNVDSDIKILSFFYNSFYVLAINPVPLCQVLSMLFT